MSMTTVFRPSALASSAEESFAPWVSDDECLSRLARAVAEHDDSRLGEVAELIGRLAVPIE